MTSALQSAVQSIELNNYATLILPTAVGYDYILTLSDEIEYIWSKPWTKVSTLYVLARYPGLFLCVVIAFCNATIILSYWAQLVFFSAAELAMILRVWALHNRSVFILGILLTIYAVEIISYLVESILFTIHNIAYSAGVLDFSFCVDVNSLSFPVLLVDVSQILLGALMCLLVVFHFIQVSLQVYRATKQFSMNRYINLLVREGMVYFLAILTYVLVALFIGSSSGWRAFVIVIIQYTPPYALAPRFIINLRKLYARGGRTSDMDTAFGFSATAYSGSVSTIMYAGQDEELEEEPVEEMEMGETDA